MTVKVFLNYRRGDGQFAAARLQERLAERFQLFMDVDQIQAGAQFPAVVRRALEEADVLLAVIGRQWLTLTAESGGRRIDQPDDWVAEEIGIALWRGTPIIPVLLDDTPMPGRDDLPPALVDLASWQALRIAHESFRADFERLIETIQRVASAVESDTVNLWEDPDYPQARGAFLQELWPAAIEGFERVLRRHPRRQDVVEQLDEARRKQNLLDLEAGADRAAQAGQWGEAVDNLKAIDALQPSDEIKARLAQAQRIHALVYTGNWNAALAAEAELTRLNREAGDLDGLATKARAELLEGGPVAPGRIFISYRRAESGYPTGWLYERLVNHFGREDIVRDIDSIEPGDDFVEVIDRAVASCDVMLVVIGTRWISITDVDGRRRLDDSEDFVRREIEAALQRDIRVIPILVDGATMPRSEQLPPSLVNLSRRQAVVLSPERFQDDTDRLMPFLDRTVSQEKKKRHSED